MSGRQKFLKVISYNLIIFFILILFFELIFGYWFKDENFGIYIRDQRNVEKKFDIIHYGKNYKYTLIKAKLISTEGSLILPPCV